MRLLFVFLSIFTLSTLADTLREEIQSRSVDYFLQNAHPKTGLVRDRTRNFSVTPKVFPYTVSSIAATGFGFAVLSDAAERGLVDRETGYRLILKALRTTANLEHFHGWLYHFIDWETGKRQGNSEISTIDTAIFLAGALHAARVFPHSELEVLAKALFKRVDFLRMMTNGGTKPFKRSLSMGWTPEGGYLTAEWDSYSEHLLLILLGLAHPTRPLPPEVWHAWERPVFFVSGEGILGVDLPLFAHQYPQLFIDFRKAPPLEIYFENSKKASHWNRRFCQSQSHKFETYRKGFWGLSASDSQQGYTAFSPTLHDGTVCPGCAGASFHYDSRFLEDLSRWKNSTFLFGKYGFADAVNFESRWVGEDIIGITVGALYLSLSGAFESPSPELLYGLERAAVQESFRLGPKCLGTYR